MERISFKKIIVFLLINVLGFSILNVSAQTEKASFKVATYNIRYDAVDDLSTGNSWLQRKDALFDLIERHDFDIFGTQEGLFKQMIDVKNSLTHYDFISYPYGGKNDHHQNAIVYKKDLFKPIDAGVFWLSETPNVPSIGWDATDRRICQWVQFLHIPSGKYFYFFNAHFYWRNHDAKQNSGALIANKIKEIAGSNSIVCVGDFNSTSETSQLLALKKVLNDSYDVSRNGRKGVLNTNLGGGNFQSPPKDRIDYIMLSKDILVNDYMVISDQYGDKRYPSDHLPVSSVISF